MNLLKGIKLRQKFILTVSSFLIPLVVVVTLLVQVSFGNINFNSLEVRGAQVLRPLYGFLFALPYLQKDGSSGALEEMDKIWTEARLKSQANQTYLKLNQKEMESRGKADFNPEQAQKYWTLLKNTNLEAITWEETRVKLEKTILGLITYISDSSNLTLDPDLDSYYLMNLTAFQLPAYWQRLSDLYRSFRIGKDSDALRSDFLPLSLQVDLPGILSSVGTAIQEDPHFMGVTPGMADTLNLQTSQLKNSLEKLTTVLSQDKSTNASAIFIPSAMEAVSVLTLKANAYLESLCQLRLEKYSRDLIFSLVWSGLAIILGLGLMIGVLWMLIKQTRDLKVTVEALTGGDFTRNVPVLTRDELGEVSENLNSLTRGLQERFLTMDRVLTKLTESAERAKKYSSRLDEGNSTQASAYSQIISAASQLAGSAQVLGQNADHQARELQGSTDSIAGLLTWTRDLSGRMKEAQGLTQERADNARREVENLDKGLQHFELLASDLYSLDQGMVQVQTESLRIDEVLGSLNDMASRTGLLAMNASIEAAHAGAAGKGFAVVADEIRKLSEQANQSVIASSKLLGSVREKIEEGTQLSRHSAQEAGQLADLSRSVRNQLHNLALHLDTAADLLAEVDSQMTEQTPRFQSLEDQSLRQAKQASLTNQTTSQQILGTQEIQKSLGNLSSLTGETAETAAELKIMAASLEEDSRTLKKLVEALRY